MGSKRSAWGIALLASGTLQLSASALFCATLAWHIHVAGSYQGTYVVIPGWIVWTFTGLSLAVLLGAMVLVRGSRRAPGDSRWRLAALAATLTGIAWLILGCAWAILRAG
jgi:hypothetical protein